MKLPVLIWICQLYLFIVPEINYQYDYSNSSDSESEAESIHSAGVSPATSASMSITHRTAELQLLSPPPPPLPDPSSIQVETNPALLLRLATAYHEWLPQPPPYPVPVLHPSLFREGPFDATTEHPLITNQRDGCPNLFISYQDYEHSLVDTPFGLQVHHPQFLEWVEVPQSARLLGRPPAEWLRVMSREQTLNAAFQLQRDASLMSSNLNVMQPAVRHKPAPYGVGYSAIGFWPALLSIGCC